MHKRKIFYVLASLLVAAGIGAYTFGPGVPQLTEAEAQAPLEGTEIRPFVKGSLASIVEGRNGQPFVLVFWSTYFAVCLVEKIGSANV